MERREFLGAGVGTLVGTGLVGTASATDHEDNPTDVDGSTPYRAKVNQLRYPLAGVPAVEAHGDTLRVELDAGAVPDPSAVTASLSPSFGRAQETTDLDRVGTDPDPGGSRIWNEAEGESENVVVARFEVPAVTPTLYDLTVSWVGGEDSQPRALRVYETIPDEPRVAVIADPQLGDPRALGTGARESWDDRSPRPFVDRATKLTGDGPRDRWEATRRAVAEVNALDPDLVLVAGDLTLGQDAPGKYYAEYEDAWDILNRLRVPSFCTLGNHDGYVQSGTDGKALYRQTFGPPSYAVDVGDCRVVAVDTYDWSYLDRAGASVAISTYGGQVRDPQFDWLSETLRGTDQSVLAFGHHNPTWKPDPKTDREEQTEGTPVAEQVARGSRAAESGQLWTGPNPYRLRRLFHETGVAAYFCGHSHRDRVARTVDDGGAFLDVVETPGPRSAAGRNEPYHYLSYTGGGDDTRVGPAVTIELTDEGAHLADELRDTSLGPCYVNCTTTQSSTGEYWGWRTFAFDTTTAGFDPAAMRYPMSGAFLDERAVNPGRWNPDHDEVGLFSAPSYLLSVAESGSMDTGGVTVTVTNDHGRSFSGALLVSVAATDPTVTGADVVWSRTVDGETDLKLAYDVVATGETAIEIT